MRKEVVSKPWRWSLVLVPYSEAERQEAQELAQCCKTIEGRGDVPSAKNVVWQWEDPATLESRPDEYGEPD